MEKSKLVSILRTLSKREISRLDEFVRSPFYNKNEKIIRLNEVICSVYPFRTGDENLKKEKLYEKAFPSDKYNEGKLKNLVSDIYEIICKFLICISAEKNSFDHKTELLRVLRERNAEKPFRAEVSGAAKSLLSFKLKDRKYFYYKWKAEAEKDIFLVERDRIKYGMNLQNELDNFINYSLFVLIELYIRMINEEGYMNIIYRRTLLKEILELFNSTDFSGNPVLEIYFDILQLRLTFEEKYFIRLKELKTKHFDIISTADMYVINSNLQGFYLAQLNSGNSAYQNDYFELQKETLEVFDKDQTISYIFFLNIVKTATGLNKFDWAKDFISKFREKLSAKYRSAAVNFSNAYIYYRQGDPEKALEILSITHTETMQINLEIKKLTMIIYYETGLFESALSIVDSFRHFIKAEKIKPNELKKVLSGFANFYGDLVKFRINDNTEGAALLLKKIEGQPYVSNKTWLIKKMKEFTKTITNY